MRSLLRTRKKLGMTKESNPKPLDFGESRSFCSCGVAGNEFTLKLAESTFGDCVTGIFHELKVKVEVVKGENALGDKFAGPEAVA